MLNSILFNDVTKTYGDWATHDAKWRGNWSPYVPRNIQCKIQLFADCPRIFVCFQEIEIDNLKIFDTKILSIFSKMGDSYHSLVGG